MIKFGDAITKISSRNMIIEKPGEKTATGFLKAHISKFTSDVGDSFTSKQPLPLEPIFIKKNPLLNDATKTKNITPFEIQLKPMFITRNPFHQ